jgi:hypothetical protein
MPLLDLNALAAVWLARRPAPEAPRGLGGRLLLGGLGVLALSSALGLGALAGRQALQAPAWIGPWLDRLGFALGAGGALWDGGPLLEARPWRPFRLQRRTLLAGEFLLGLTTGAKRALAALLFTAALGSGLPAPSLLPWALLTAVLLVLWAFGLERLLHALMPGALRFLRLPLAIGLLVGAWALHHTSVGSTAWTPGNQLARVAEGLLRGGAVLAPLGWTALSTSLMLALTTWALVPALSRSQNGSALVAGRPPTFRCPWRGLAGMHLRQLLVSRAGQLRLVMVFLAVLGIKEPELISLGRLHAPRAWVALWFALTFGTVLAVPLCNLLGLDRGGIRTWWVLPLEDRDLLKAKVAGTAAYAGLVAGLLCLAVGTFHGIRQVEGPGLLLLLAFVFLWCAGSGLERSILASWSQAGSSYGIQLDFTDEKVARLGVALAPIPIAIPLYALTVWIHPMLAAMAMAGLCLLALHRLRHRLDAASQLLDLHREHINRA